MHYHFQGIIFPTIYRQTRVLLPKVPQCLAIKKPKWTYLMAFPPCSDPKCAIKLSKLCTTHVLTSITCYKCEIPFPLKVEVQMDPKQLLPHKTCTWLFNVNKSELIHFITCNNYTLNITIQLNIFLKMHYLCNSCKLFENPELSM